MRREEILAFLFGEEHKIGFLHVRDIIKREAVREVPVEGLEQLEKEEAVVNAWLQVEQRRVPEESTGQAGQRRRFSEGSSGRPDPDDFQSGVGSSSGSSHKGKRKRGQGRSRRRQRDSPDVEVPLRIAKEVSGSAGEPLE